MSMQEKRVVGAFLQMELSYHIALDVTLSYLGGAGMRLQTNQLNTGTASNAISPVDRPIFLCSQRETRAKNSIKTQ